MLQHAHEQVLCRHWIATAFAQIFSSVCSNHNDRSFFQRRTEKPFFLFKRRLFLFSAKLTLTPNPHPVFRMAHFCTEHLVFGAPKCIHTEKHVVYYLHTQNTPNIECGSMDTSLPHQSRIDECSRSGIKVNAMLMC